ncbi:hypothetical protein LSH36_96g05017 [Paralvinella palmiformis]|uniref:Galectin n=1 Tax=Paralvinella palmiformis TaxID=53620 RepID=A0AAD9K0L4_9ANNE|nr:hypothetical protein LSH36_96g05017 [Paralvinella palmiformis]
MQMEGILKVSKSGREWKEPVLYANGSLINPSIPYCEELKPLCSGDTIIINGSILMSSKSFTINLQRLKENGKFDVVMHVGVRFGQNVVIRNHCVDGQWFEEEKSGGLGKLEKGKHFECLLMVCDKFFKIAFNGQHHSEFAHRLPYKQITHLLIEGGVQIDSLLIQAGPESRPQLQSSSMPLVTYCHQPPASGDQVCTEQKMSGYPPLYGLPVPHRDEIQGGLKPSTVIYISGIPSKRPKQFVIDLRPVPLFGQVDKALHFKVQMKEKVIVLNTFEDGKWGEELRITERFPFQGGVHYDLVFLCTKEGFKVSVNNVHLTDYKHRMTKLETINMIEVSGATKLIHIRKLI